MTAHINRLFLTSKKTQTGVATTVFIILVGLALTATGTGVINSVQSNQQKQIAVNAVTHAQTGVWVGAEAFRLYLAELDAAAINQLSGNASIGLQSSFGNVEARDITVTEPTTGVFRVSANIRNVHAAAQSAAVLNVVFEVDPATPASGGVPSVILEPALNFNDDLTLNGNLFLNGEDGGTFDLRVNGDVDLSNLGVNPLGTIEAIGKVTISSNVVVEHIYANDDVELNSTTVETVRTLGNFLGTGSAAVESLQANGNVVIDSGGRFASVYSLGNVEINRGSPPGHGYINAAGTIAINQGPVETSEAVGNISHDNYVTIGTATSMADIQCSNASWANFTELSANGNLVGCVSSADALSGQSRVVTNMPELQPYTFTETEIDVWPLKSTANYIVEYDDNQGRIKVTVYDVNGIDNGSEYFLGDYVLNDGTQSINFYDYLCESVDSSGDCLIPTEPLMPLCVGDTLYGGCIDYVVSTDTFKMKPNISAPGIMWFDGNLDVGGAIGMTTYLATGNISTRDSFITNASNYAGYDSTCLGTSDHLTGNENGAINKPEDVRARYQDEYSNYYPTNLCDIANSTYQPTNTGNIALAAGGYPPDNNDTYFGGNIVIGAESKINGAVLAGNVLETKGNATIFGYVSATGKGTDPADTNQFNGTTVINLSTGNMFYNPLTIPDMNAETAETRESNGGSGSGSGSNPSTDDSVARMLWVRYL